MKKYVIALFCSLFTIAVYAQSEPVFSVSKTTKVRFSKGNLQYQASTDTWRFAENQTDCIGEANCSVFRTAEDWIDLFEWRMDWYRITVSNDESQPQQCWRTLTKQEWAYLYKKRPKALKKCGVAYIDGVNGLVFLPDNWVLPEGCKFKAGINAFGTNPAYSFAVVNE